MIRSNYSKNLHTRAPSKPHVRGVIMYSSNSDLSPFVGYASEAQAYLNPTAEDSRSRENYHTDG